MALYLCTIYFSLIHCLKTLDWVTSNKFLRFLKQLQPVAWHQEKTDTGVEAFLKYKVRKEANKVILNGLFSEVSKTRDAVREWKAVLLSLFFFSQDCKRHKYIYQNKGRQFIKIN